MGCTFDIWLASEDRYSAEIALGGAKRFVDDSELVMSRFKPESELSRLNRRSGERIKISEDLIDAVAAAVDAAEASGGLYDPTVLPALLAAGYDRSFAEMNQTATRPSSNTQSNDLGRWYDIEIDEPSNSITLPLGIQLDLGGIGKAWAAHEAAELLWTVGPCIVSAGGDIAVKGEPYPGDRWSIAVRDPFGGKLPLTTLEITNCGVATSGVDFRKWEQNGKQQHHLIDPRTGQPAITDLLSVTVVAPHVLTAEQFALSAMIVGLDDGLTMIEKKSGIEGLFVRSDGKIAESSGFKSLCVTGRSGGGE